MMIKNVVAMMVDGVTHFVNTRWALQERRWSNTFHIVMSATVSVTMPFVLCFLSAYNHMQRRGDIVFFASF